MTVRAARWWQGGVCAALWLSLGGSLQAAGGLSVSPVRLELDDARPVATLRVINRASRTSRVQTEVLRWRQAGGEAEYTASTELLVTPPIFEVPPQSEQVVRVGFLQVPPERLLEQAYRVFFREIPRPGQEEGGVQLLLRIGIPIFLRPSQIQRQLRVQSSTQAAGSLLISNPGNVHVRIDAVQWLQGGAVGAEQRQLRYLFPGERQHWAPPTVPARVDRIQVSTELGVEDFRLELPPR